MARAIETVTSDQHAGSLAGQAELIDYWTLLKPNVMKLVVFTGGVGLAIAPGSIHPLIAFVAILAMAVGAGASAAINNAYDSDIDRVMIRTRRRPTAAGRIEPAEALTAGVVLAILSIGVMGVAVNWVAASILALTIGFYVFIYTLWLKRRTPQNIVIGGAAGAFPPLIGWAAVTGGLELMPILLFLVVFFWTPPHFWALALYRQKDYADVGVPMLPVAAGAEATRRQILGYSVVLFVVSLTAFGDRHLGLALCRVWRSASRAAFCSMPGGSTAGPAIASPCASSSTRSSTCSRCFRLFSPIIG